MKLKGVSPSEEGEKDEAPHELRGLTEEAEG